MAGIFFYSHLLLRRSKRELPTHELIYQHAGSTVPSCAREVPLPWAEERERHSLYPTSFYLTPSTQAKKKKKKAGWMARSSVLIKLQAHSGLQYGMKQ